MDRLRRKLSLSGKSSSKSSKTEGQNVASREVQASKQSLPSQLSTSGDKGATANVQSRIRVERKNIKQERSLPASTEIEAIAGGSEKAGVVTGVENTVGHQQSAVKVDVSDKKKDAIDRSQDKPISILQAPVSGGHSAKDYQSLTRETQNLELWRDDDASISTLETSPDVSSTGETDVTSVVHEAGDRTVHFIKDLEVETGEAHLESPVEVMAAAAKEAADAETGDRDKKEERIRSKLSLSEIEETKDTEDDGKELQAEDRLELVQTLDQSDVLRPAKPLREVAAEEPESHGDGISELTSRKVAKEQPDAKEKTKKKQAKQEETLAKSDAFDTVEGEREIQSVDVRSAETGHDIKQERFGREGVGLEVDVKEKSDDGQLVGSQATHDVADDEQKEEEEEEMEAEEMAVVEELTENTVGSTDSIAPEDIEFDEDNNEERAFDGQLRAIRIEDNDQLKKDAKEIDPIHPAVHKDADPDLQLYSLKEEEHDAMAETESTTRNLEYEDDFARLEETVRGSDDGNQIAGTSSSVSAQIREIVTKHLSTEDLTEDVIVKPQNLDVLKDENSTLLRELERMEDLLAATRAEREEIGIKYNALSERLDQLLRHQNLDRSELLDEETVKTLLSQNMDLRRRMDEERQNYQRRVQTYHDGQKQQAQLVHRLQSKVIQYKQKCDELETSVTVRNREVDDSQTRMNYLTGRVEGVEARLTGGVENLDSALIRLDEEQQRCGNLIQVNSLLREQLEAATEANQSLASDVQKLTHDWEMMRGELELKESEWRDEEQNFNEYFMAEHNRLLSVWKDAAKFRREFGEMKTLTERDLNKLRLDLDRVATDLKTACVTMQQHSPPALLPSFGSFTENPEFGQVSGDHSNQNASFNVMSPSELWHRIQELSLAQAEALSEKSEFLARCEEVKSANEQLKQKLDEKERMMNSLKTKLHKMGTENESGDKHASSKLRDQNRALYSTLKDIANRVVSDVEGVDSDQDHNERDGGPSVSFLVGLLNQGHSEIGGGDGWSGGVLSTTVLDSITSTIESALNKRSFQMENVNTKLKSLKEQQAATQRKYEDCVEHGRMMEDEIRRLKSQMESSFSEKTDLISEVERLKMKNHILNEEKEQIERSKTSLMAQLQELNADNGKLRNEALECIKSKEGLADEREGLVLETEKRRKENEISQKTIYSLEDKLTSVKDELVATKERLRQITLANDVLLIEKDKFEEKLNHSEKLCHSLEIETARLKATGASLRDILTKLHGDSEMIDQEKTELSSIVKKLSEEKIALSAEIAELEQEKSGLRDEVLRIEQEKLELAEEKSALQERLEVTERTQVAIQSESDGHAREKRELNSQLLAESRKRASLMDDVAHLTHELNRRMEIVEATIREKERLTKERSDLTVRIETVEREARSLSETLAALRVEKNNLEMSLYERQQAFAALSLRKSQLEAEKQAATERMNNLQEQINQLLKDVETERSKGETMKSILEKRFIQLNREHLSIIEKAHKEHQEKIDHLVKEKETARQQLETSYQEELQRAMADKDEATSKLEVKLESFHRQLESNQREFHEKAISFEREKEKVLSSLRKEKSKLQEQLLLLQKDLQASQVMLDKEKMDAMSKAKQHKTITDDLHLQLRGLKSQMEDANMTHEKALKDLKNKVHEVGQQKELAVQDANVLRGKLQVAEEARDNLRKELSDTLRKLKEAGEKIESLHSDLSDLSHNISEERSEKKSFEKSNDQLQNKLKHSESERGELKRSLEECYQKITVVEASSITSSKEAVQLRETLQEVEKSRLDLRKEVHNLKRQMKGLEESLQTKSLEVGDLGSRLAREEERDENNRREIFSFKHKLSDVENVRDSLRKDLLNLQRQLSEMKDIHVLRERDLQQALNEAERHEQQLEEHRRHLDELLKAAGNTTDDLKSKLSSAEGKVGALETQQLKLECAKKDVEHKLASIYSSLRRYVGLGTETEGMGRVIFSPLKRRRQSPGRGFAGVVPVAFAEIDTELVQNTLCNVMQQILSLEKDKEECVSQVNSLKEQLSAMQREKASADGKLVQAQTSLANNQQASHSMALQLANVQKTVATQHETVALLQKEKISASDKIATLEQRIRTFETEIVQYLDKINRLQQSESNVEQENVSLRDAVSQLETKVSQADHAKRNLESELQRVRMDMTDKDTELQVVQERLDTLNKRVQELEEKAISLQVTIDRLNLSLERSAEDEHELKDKLQSLNKSLSESTTSGWSLQEKIHQLQKALANSENERRVVQERLENSKQTMNESKKSNLAISERVQQLRAELSNYEDRCRDLEKQIQSSEKLLIQHNENDQQNLQQIQRLQKEKHLLQNTVAELQRTLAQLEVEKQDFHRWHILLEKDKSALKQTLDKVERERLMSEELVTRGTKERSNFDRSFNTIQKDNIDLQRRLQALENQLAEQEKHHSEKLLSLTSRHRQEKDNEMERLRSSQMQAERTLELRERAHRQRVLGLEQQIQLYRDQLNQEIRKRQLYIQQSTHAGDEMKNLQQTLDESLKSVSRNASLDAMLLEHETRKLDSAVDRHLSLSRPTSILRGRSRTVSPVRSLKNSKSSLQRL